MAKAISIQKRTSVGKEEVLACISISKGQLLPIEERLNCTRSALRDVIAKYPEIQTELNDELERQKDRIIIAMLDDCIEGEDKLKSKARETLLKAIARDRGFGEKLEVTGANGQPLVFLHSSAKMLSREDWVTRAEKYAAEENAAIDAKITELGIGGAAPRALPGGKHGK
jgi:hypothetical protein